MQSKVLAALAAQFEQAEKAQRQKDRAVVTALGTKFEQFQKLALLAKEQPATRSYVKGQMLKLLMTMTVTEQCDLHEALRKGRA